MTPAPKSSLWYLQFEGSEFGPLTLTELKATLVARKIQGTIYVWNSSLENWVVPQAVTELAEALKQAPGDRARRPQSASRRILTVSASPSDRDKRKNERQSLVATVSMVTPPRTRLMLGICEDISLEGLQIILDADHEIAEGTEFTLEIHPIGISGVPTFRMQAKAIWRSTELRRIGFTFARLNPIDRRGLELYLETAGRSRVELMPSIRDVRRR